MEPLDIFIIVAFITIGVVWVFYSFLKLKCDTEQELEEKDKELERADARIEELVNEAVKRGFASFEYKHEPNRLAHTNCKTTRAFYWLDDKDVIKSILDKRKGRDGH